MIRLETGIYVYDNVLSLIYRNIAISLNFGIDLNNMCTTSIVKREYLLIILDCDQRFHKLELVITLEFFLFLIITGFVGGIMRGVYEHGIGSLETITFVFFTLLFYFWCIINIIH